jgi:drug/metabolite transporter (DMT)-like permease
VQGLPAGRWSGRRLSLAPADAPLYHPALDHSAVPTVDSALRTPAPQAPAIDGAPAKAARNPGILLGMLVLYVVWGSTYLGIAVAVQSIPPFLMAATRFVLAGLILLALSRIRGGREFEWPTRREWRDSLIVGGLLLGGGMGMVAFAEQTIPSGITAILIAMLPVWVAIFSRLFFGERLPRGAVVGIAIGFVGVAVLVGPTALGIQGGLEPLGLAAAILSPISWSLGSLFASHRAVLPRRPLVLAGAEMLAGGLILVAMSAGAGELADFHVADVTASSFVALTYLTVVGSLIAFTTYGWLLRKAPLSLIATYAYVNPVVAVILGFVVLQEPIEPRTIVAGAIIVFAVALIVTARSRMLRPAERMAADRSAAARVGGDATPEAA